MRQGLARHGIIAGIHDPTRVIDCDLAVFWGHRRSEIIARQRCTGRRYLVMERGYLGDRHKWTSLAYDGLNGHGQFYVPTPVTEARFVLHHAELMKPWRKPAGGYALIMGQVPGDASLKGQDLAPWYRRIAGMIERQHRCQVLFRPHPQAVSKGILCRTGLQEDRSELSEALQGAAFVVTFNSNSAVDAVLAGVPAIVFDQGSMAWPVCGHDLGQIVMPDRMEWAARLAWCQWTLDEIADGSAWDVLQKGIQ